MMDEEDFPVGDETTRDSLDRLYSEKRALDNLVSSEGWKIYSGWMREQIGVREQTIRFGECPTMDNLPEHFKKIGEIAAMEFFLKYIEIRSRSIDEELTELNLKLEMRENNES